MKLESEQILNSKYRLIKRIGSGGFSVVWLAEDFTSDGQKYAIKIYAPQQGLNPEDVELFELEYKRLSELSHPYIINTKAYFKIEESPCLVLNYCAGGSLQQKIKSQGNLSESDIAKIMVHISGALNYLHDLPVPVYHLDLKPDNILIDDEENYILTDFGISNEVRSTILRRSMVVAETFSYRSPERALNHNLSNKHDVFSFGVVLIEGCIGFFDPKFSLADSMLKGYPLPEINGYSARLTEILYHIIELDPEDRPSALDVYNFGLHFLEKGFWPAINKKNRTKKYQLGTAYELRPEIASPTKPIPQWQTYAVITVVIISLLALIFGFIWVSRQNHFQKTNTQESIVEICEKLENEIDSLLKKGKFLSIKNLSLQGIDDCSNIGKISNKLNLSQKCLSLLELGSESFNSKKIREAQKNYQEFQNCGCPEDSLSLVKNRLKLIPDLLNLLKMKNQSLNTIERASN